MKKIKQRNKKKTIFYQYRHEHPLMFFVLVFNIFVVTIIFVTNAMIDDLDIISARRIVFNEPDPRIERKAIQMLHGTPMESMVPYIAQHNDTVAGYLIAIAKKESQWGDRSPKLNGDDCFNYWGFRKKQERMGSGGHTCFDSREEAVYVVGKRMNNLIKKGYDTPAELVLWKCGRCDGPEAIGAQKWISDVAYYKKIYDDL